MDFFSNSLLLRINLSDVEGLELEEAQSPSRQNLSVAPKNATAKMYVR